MPDIDFQRIELNLIPKQGDEPVIFYASQYETTRPFIADLMWGETEFAPGGDCWAEIDIRKNDDNLVVITEDVVIDNNEVSVILPIQALTCIGKNLGQVKIYAGEDQLIAALNFILEVQPDPLAGGVTSETAIDNLESQIAAIVPEVIGEDYYDKTEVDALLADKADVSDLPDMSNYYTKSETYSSGQIDYSMSLKADKSELDDYALKTWVTTNFVTPSYLGTHYYNKTQVDALLYNMLPEGTASGSIASFTTEIAGNLTALKCNMLASGGGGTPDNPIPIVGFTECNITNEDGEGNVIDEITIDLGGTRYGGYVDVNNGKLVVNPVPNKVTLNGTENWSLSASGSSTSVFMVYAFKNDVKDEDNQICSHLVFNPNAYQADNTPNSFVQGSSGNFFIEISNDIATTVEGFKTWLATQYANSTPVEYIYNSTATPIEIDISPEHLYANVGQNNVFHDCNGTTEVKYKDTIQHYIDTRI